MNFGPANVAAGSGLLDSQIGSMAMPDGSSTRNRSPEHEAAEAMDPCDFASQCCP